MLVLILGTANSCLIDDSADYEDNDKGTNLVGFVLTSTSLGAVADGNEYQYSLNMKVLGPTYRDVKSTITATVAVDESSTAVEGVHFRLDNPTVTFSPDNNLLNTLPVTILTEGIRAPLDVAPVMVLKVTDVSGDNNVLNSGKTIAVTLNYGCFSNLAGTYTLTINRVNLAGVASTYTRTDEVITKTGIGEYRTTYVGHWLPGDLAPGTPGFTFVDVCNKITIDEQNLANLYSNLVKGTIIGTVNPDTGDLYMEYSICTDDGCNFYKCTYVKQ